MTQPRSGCVRGLALCLFIGSFVLLAGCAAPEPVHPSQARISEAVESIRERVRASAGLALLSAEKSVRFRAADTNPPWLIAATFQLTHDDAVLIALSTVYYDLVSFAASLAVVLSDVSESFDECLAGYGDFVRASVARQSLDNLPGAASVPNQREKGLAKLKAIADAGKGAEPNRSFISNLAPRRYFSEQGEPCRELAAYFPLDTAQQGLRDRIARDVVQATYLHELAHVALGHIPKRKIEAEAIEKEADPDFRRHAIDAALKSNRQREFAADLWGIDKYFALADDPLRIIRFPALRYYLTLTSDRDCWRDGLRSHPTGDRRAGRIYARLLALALRSQSPNRLAKTDPLYLEADEFVTAARQRESRCP